MEVELHFLCRELWMRLRQAGWPGWSSGHPGRPEGQPGRPGGQPGWPG